MCPVLYLRWKVCLIFPVVSHMWRGKMKYHIKCYMLSYFRIDNQDPPSPVWRQPGGTSAIALDTKPTYASFDAIADAAGRWECNLDEPDTLPGYVDVCKELIPKPCHRKSYQIHIHFSSTFVHHLQA